MRRSQNQVIVLIGKKENDPGKFCFFFFVLVVWEKKRVSATFHKRVGRT